MTGGGLKLNPAAVKAVLAESNVANIALSLAIEQWQRGNQYRLLLHRSDGVSFALNHAPGNRQRHRNAPTQRQSKSRRERKSESRRYETVTLITPFDNGCERVALEFNRASGSFRLFDEQSRSPLDAFFVPHYTGISINRLSSNAQRNENMNNSWARAIPSGSRIRFASVGLLFPSLLIRAIFFFIIPPPDQHLKTPTRFSSTVNSVPLHPPSS